MAAFGRRVELATLLLERVRPFVGEPLSWELLAPEDLEARLGLAGAQIHHLPHGADRPGPALGDGIFLCGAGTRPGGEVSGCRGRRRRSPSSTPYPE